jgi:heat shock protein HslJ
MRRLPLLFIFLLACLSLIAAACGGDSSTVVGAPDSDDTGTDDVGASDESNRNALVGAWILVDATVDGIPLVLLDDYAVTMNIDGEEIGGRAACNSYGGSLVLGDTEFGSTDVFQTEMGCEGAAMSLEYAYLSALTRAGSWDRTGDVVELTGDGVSLTFEIVAPPATADLVDTAWVLDTVIEAETSSSTIGGADAARLSFDAGGYLTGTTGCRSFAGEFIETGSTITITKLTMTGDCDTDLVWQDNAVVSVLEGEISVTIDGPHLTLMAAGGEGLRYTKG